MAAENLSVKLTADSKGLLDGLKNVEGAVLRVTESLSLLSKGTSALGDITQATAVLADSSKALASAGGDLSQIKEALNGIQSAQQAFAESTAESFNAVKEAVTGCADTFTAASESTAEAAAENTGKTGDSFKKAAKSVSESGRTIENAAKRMRFSLLGGLKGISSGFKQATGKLKQFTGGLAGLAKSALLMGGLTLGIKSLVDSFKAFTSIESSMSRTSDIFGAAGKHIKTFAEGSAKNLGMAESAVYEYASTFGNLFKNITADSTENAAVSIKMMQASAVIASKTGRTMEDVMGRIRSGLLGSTEAIEDLGINVNISMLEMTDAFKKIANGRSWNQLTFYEQQQVRTLGILEQAHKNFGDEVQQGSTFALSNLSSAFKDLQSAAGGFVNAALLPIIKGLTTVVQLAATALKHVGALFGLNATLAEETDAGMSAGSGAAEDMAGGLEDSAKAAQKLNRQLAGFDKFNDITKTDTGGGAAGASGGGALGGMGITWEPLEMPEPDTSWLDKLTQRFHEFGELLGPLKTSLGGLWDTLKMVGGFAWDGLDGFMKGFLKPVGEWTLGDGLPRFVDAVKLGLESVDWENLNTHLDKLWAALTPFAINVGEGLLWLYENVLSPLNTWTMNEVVPRFLDILTNALDFLNTTIDVCKPGFQWIWDKFLDPVAKWTGGRITGTLDKINEKIQEATKWVEDNRETVDKALRNLGDSLGWLWETVLKPLFDRLWEKADDTIEFILDSFGNMIEFLTGVFAGDWEMAWDALFDYYKDLLIWMSPYTKEELETLKLAWQAVADWFETTLLPQIKAGFKGLINDLIWLTECFANGFIQGFNNIIDALNIPIKFPDWMGGGSFGLNIPRISKTVSLPRLANGGLAYGEVQAIVGDNRNARQDPEVISPLSRLQDMITAAMVQRDISGGGSGQVVELRLTMEDGTPLVEALIDPMNRTAKNLGYGPVFRASMA